MSDIYDVAIIGAGASGLFAAITAARLGASVVLLDKNSIVGRKLLSTGNGRCNFLNEYQSLECYRTQAPSEAKRVLDHLPKEEVLSFFDSIGIAAKSRNGYYYPYTNQAKDVRDCLDMELRRLEITTLLSSDVRNLSKKDNYFEISANQDLLKAKKCILATGGKAFPKSGSDGWGYKAAQSFGHSIIEPFPALTQIYSNDKSPFKWEGTRIDAAVSIIIDDTVAASDTGEIQLTKSGISGIPVFNVSRYAAMALKKNYKAKAVLNFLPHLTDKEACRIMQFRFFENGWGKSALEAMRGLLDIKLSDMILDELGIQKSCDAVSLGTKAIKSIVEKCRGFELDITGTGDFDKAQTTAGGVPLAEINPDTMESRFCSGLYICGELLDVDGICGGYNLNWAWVSGYTCGAVCKMEAMS